MIRYKLENVLYSLGMEGSSASIPLMSTLFGSVNLIIKQIDFI